MREIKDHAIDSDERVLVAAIDGPGAGGAWHKYLIDTRINDVVYPGSGVYGHGTYRVYQWNGKSNIYPNWLETSIKDGDAFIEVDKLVIKATARHNRRVLCYGDYVIYNGSLRGVSEEAFKENFHSPNLIEFNFQNGGVAESGVNGITNEALIWSWSWRGWIIEGRIPNARSCRKCDMEIPF